MIFYTPVEHHSIVRIEKNAQSGLFEFFYRGREWGREQGSTPWASSKRSVRTNGSSSSLETSLSS
jgi:hypothetical protein